jgi:hypothetical protein
MKIHGTRLSSQKPQAIIAWLAQRSDSELACVTDTSPATLDRRVEFDTRYRVAKRTGLRHQTARPGRNAVASPIRNSGIDRSAKPSRHRTGASAAAPHARRSRHVVLCLNGWPTEREP